MRLIDADKFKAYMQDNYVLYDHTLADIYAQPTIEAIPVEWIKKYMKRHLAYRQNVLEDMLEDWEAENESDCGN